jgi:hypothetical protein
MSTHAGGSRAEPVAHDPIWRDAGSLEDARLRIWEPRRS